VAENNNTKKDDKWDFSDYAFTITGILVGVLLVLPEIMYAQFGISILGGTLGDLDIGPGGRWTINELRALSPMLFLLTTTIVFFQEAIVARKSGGYEGSMFTHTFESLFEDAIYMAITTIMVYGAVLFGAMSSSWLAGPITWILFMFMFPLVKKKRGDAYEFEIPWAMLSLFVAGIIIEIITGMWIAFPVTWLVICIFKFIGAIRVKIETVDDVFDILYYGFSVILMGLGIGMGLWITSWTAFPIALIICWILSKFKRFKKVKPEMEDAK